MKASMIETCWGEAHEEYAKRAAIEGVGAFAFTLKDLTITPDTWHGVRYMHAEYIVPDGGSITVDLVPVRWNDELSFIYSIHSPRNEDGKSYITGFREYPPPDAQYSAPRPISGFQVMQIMVDDWDFIVSKFGHMSGE